MNRHSMNDVRQTFLSASSVPHGGRQECLPHGFVAPVRGRKQGSRL